MNPQLRFFLPLFLSLLACPLSGAAAGEPAPVKRVALVFDDGPVPASADPLLALLAKEKVPVTFSLVGTRVKEHPETARAMLKAGHEVVNHSMTHASPNDLDAKGVDREVIEAQETLTSLLGAAPKWYWPPYLHINDKVTASVERAKIRIYIPHHLVGSKDYDTSVSAAEILRLSTTDVRDGSVILFHEWRTESREQLPAILAELRRQNCSFMTFSALHEALNAK